MARAMARVEGAWLINPADAPSAIAVGTPAWYVWLEGATSFAFVGVSGHFTARKERRRQGDGYWKAYRKRGGILRSVYLGRTSDLTLDRLNTAAASLAVQLSSTPAGRNQPDDVATTSTALSAITPIQRSSHATQSPLTISPLLRTKLFLPPARPNTVARPRLIARVQAGLMGKLLLIAAPAGFGKTTLLVQGLAAWGVGIATSDNLHPPGRMLHASNVAWVSVDRADNDPPRFWRYVSTALDTLQPGCGATALALLATPEPPPIETVLTALLNDLSMVPLDAALVLDDYHLIDAGPIHQAMSFLLDHLPPQLHVIIATRTDPPLPLTRLRARHDVTELRAAELRFTPAETTSFLRETMALPLVDEDIEALEARTEGWIAGLQFAALALRDHSDRSGFVQAFRGSNRFVVDYLADEVLDQLPAHLLTFLLQTAILDRMCGSLCDAILGLSADNRQPTTGSISSPVIGGQSSAVDAYSQLLLEQLERANLFVVPLDDERHWYRYHPLFAEVLRQRLQSGAEPATLARLHGRASTWFAQQGLLPEAIQYAFAGHDSERAAQLVELAGPGRLACGQVATVRDWLAALPENLSRARPRLGLLECWTLAFSAQFVELERRLRDAVRAIAASEFTAMEQRALVSEATVLRTRVAFSRNEIPLLGELRQALLDAPEDDLRLRGLILLALGHAERLHGNASEASHVYAEANRLAQRAGDVFTAGSALVALAEHDEVRGQLHAAAETHRQGLRLATAHDGRPLPLAGFFHVGLGKQLREWNDLDAAVQHLQQGIALGQQGGMEGIALDGAITLALVLEVQGDRAGAQAMLERAAAIAQRWALPQIVLRVATFAARLALMRGHVADAARWARTQHLGADDELSEWLEIEYCTLARWQIAERRADHALRLLRRLAAAAELAGRTGRLIEILVLQALAYQAQGETATALDHLARALEMAAPERYVRVFADEGAPMAALLRAAYARRIMPEYVATLLAIFSEIMSDGGGTMKQEDTLHRASFIAPPLVEPLTARELDVLRLVVAGHSNRAIASELIVAVGTVKAHLNSIFGKLGVTSRTQAIMRANDLHLI